MWPASMLAKSLTDSEISRMKIEMNSIEQGQSGELVCKLTQVRPFEGKAKVKLQGLPNKATTEDAEEKRRSQKRLDKKGGAQKIVASCESF